MLGNIAIRGLTVLLSVFEAGLPLSLCKQPAEGQERLVLAD